MFRENLSEHHLVDLARRSSGISDQNWSGVPLTELAKRSHPCLVLLIVPVNILLAIGLGFEWQNSCDVPLQGWTVVNIILNFCLAIITFLIWLRTRPSNDANEPPEESLYSRLTRYGFLFCAFWWVTWYFSGCYWIVQAQTACADSLPTLTLAVTAYVFLYAGLFGTSLVCILFIGLVLFLRISYCPRIGGRGATIKQIIKLKHSKFAAVADKISPEDAICAICLSEYGPTEDIRFLPCKHHFHSICVDTWLFSNKVCPFCKQEIITSKIN